MTITPDFIAAQKAKLEAEKARLDKEIESVDGYPELGDSSDDNAQEFDALSDNQAMEEPLVAELAHVNQALAAIESNQYGVCTECGQEISQDRLIAYPGATLCQDCAH